MRTHTRHLIQALAAASIAVASVAAHAGAQADQSVTSAAARGGVIVSVARQFGADAQVQSTVVKVLGDDGRRHTWRFPGDTASAFSAGERIADLAAKAPGVLSGGDAR